MDHDRPVLPRRDRAALARGSLASDGASGAALRLGVPAAVVAVTVVSIGSCLFNAGAIFGIVGLFTTPAADGSLTLPLAYMGVLALALVPISRTAGKNVSRVEGAILLASCLAFLVASAMLASTAPRVGNVEGATASGIDPMAHERRRALRSVPWVPGSCASGSSMLQTSG